MQMPRCRQIFASRPPSPMQIDVMACPMCNHRLRTFAAIARAQMLSAPQLHAFARMSTCLLLTCTCACALSSAHALYTRYFYVRFCAHPYAGASSEATTLTASSPHGAASTPPCGCAALTLDTGTHDVHCLCAPLRRLRAACTLCVLPRRQSPRPSTQCPTAVQLAIAPRRLKAPCVQARLHRSPPRRSLLHARAKAYSCSHRCDAASPRHTARHRSDPATRFARARNHAQLAPSPAPPLASALCSPPLARYRTARVPPRVAVR